jgi:hypothetical protein
MADVLLSRIETVSYKVKGARVGKYDKLEKKLMGWFMQTAAVSVPIYGSVSNWRWNTAQDANPSSFGVVALSVLLPAFPSPRRLVRCSSAASNYPRVAYRSRRVACSSLLNSSRNFWACCSTTALMLIRYLFSECDFFPSNLVWLYLMAQTSFLNSRSRSSFYPPWHLCQF